MRVVALITAIVTGASGVVRAQSARQALERGSEAYNVADFESAVRLLSRGLDPAGGLRDTLWITAVHKLADALLELDADSVAAVWLRWALRQDRDMLVNTTNFPPAVVQAFETARAFVEASPQDQFSAGITWEWAAAGSDATRGRVRLEQIEIPISGRIEQGDFLIPGRSRSLAPGSYDILAAAAGYLPIRITAEVLPGVTTVIRLSPLPETAGYLYVVSRPWGTLYLDDEMLGYTPVAAHRLAPGTHELRIERSGYIPLDTIIIVEDYQRVRVGPLQLRPAR